MSLLVLGDNLPKWRPNCFEYDLWGSRVHFKFQMVKLLDFRHRLEELKKSKNPFAFFVTAHLKSLETNRKPQQRLNQKEEIAKEMMKQGFSKRRVYLLYKFIDIMMALPKDLEQVFQNNIHEYQKEKNMPILAPFEQLAMEKGEKIGEQRGSLQEAQAAVLDILSVKFGEVPSSLVKSVEKLEDLAFLRELRRYALKVDNLKELKLRIKEFEKQKKQ